MAFGRKTDPSVVVICIKCRKGVSTASKNVSREVKGWVAPRQGGGANHIKYQQPTGNYAHTACLAEMHDPVKANQAGLF